MAKKHKNDPPAGGVTVSPAASRLLQDIVGRGFDTRLVYGEPVVMGDRAVIPAAKVGWGGGGGGGAAVPGDDAPSVGESGGIGMGVWARPAGYIEVTPQHARWHSTSSLQVVVVAAAVAWVLTMFFWAVNRRR